MKTINSIYFEVNMSVLSEVVNFNSLINKELRLRNEDTSGTLEEKRCRLLIIMKKEYELMCLEK